jgi:hypothetical protein
MSFGNDINVKIGATDATAMAFRSAEMRMKSFAGSAKMIASSLGVALSARALVGLTKNAIDYGSALSDAAHATNTNVEALQVLRFAATQTGAKVEQLDKALIAANKSAVDASNGLSTAKRAFEYLNINATNFINLPTEQKLTRLAQAMSQSTDKNRAAAAVMDIIGSRNAPKLMEMLQKLGTEGFDELSKAAKAAGQVMDEDTIKRLDEASDAIERFKTRMTIKTGETLKFWLDVKDFGFKEAANQIIKGTKEIEAAATGPITVSAPRIQWSDYKDFYTAGAVAAKDFKALNDAAFDPSNMSVFYSAWAGQMERIRDEMEETGGRWGETARGIEKYSVTMSNKMADAFMEFSRTGKLAFKDFANSVIQDMVRIMIQQQITTPLAQMFTGAISSGIGGLFGGGAAASGGAADGGNIPAGRSYWVGERGPEIVTTKSGASVTPAHAVGGGPTNIYFTVNSIDSASFSSHLAKHRAEISGIVENAYNRRGRKGPMTS